MGWPQIAYLALTALGLGVTIAKHGEPRTGNHNFGVAVIASCLTLAILSAGGFFS